MRARRIALAAGLGVIAGIAGATPALATNIRIESTTDINDSGLFPNVIQPGYASAQPGDTLQFTTGGGTVYPAFVGTGVALANAQKGLADVVVTHAPSVEQDFVTQGWSYPTNQLGDAVFHNDYVIVGPNSNAPHTDASRANVAGTARHDAVAAFQAIAARGASNSDVTFVSRGDASGTNIQEQIVWGLTTGVTVAQAAGTSDPARKEPSGTCGGVGPYPCWYKKNGLGQGASVQSANACASGTYPNGSCYTMLDKGTWVNQQALGNVDNLDIDSDANSAGATGGAALQANLFHAYVVNPVNPVTGSTWISGVTPNPTAGQRLVDYLQTTSFQGQVQSWLNPPGAFLPDAFPVLTSTKPNCYDSTSHTFSYNATLAYNAPPQLGLSGLDVTLQKSVTGSGTWTTVGSPVTTDASGVATLTASGLSGNMDFRLLTAALDDPDAGVRSHFAARTTSNAINLGTSTPTHPCP